MRVAVIGAGISGLVCASALRTAGFGVTVFDKGRGVGGRTSTRREGSLRFDHGAPRLELGAPELAEQLASWETAGVVVPWQPHVREPSLSTARTTWLGVPGSNALVTHLAAGVEVELNAQVLALAQRGGWWLDVERAGARASFGPFEIVVLTAPTPQAAALLATADADVLVSTLAAATFVPCVVAMLAIETATDVDELRDLAGPLASAHRLDRRPGRTRIEGVELWVAHGSEAWSAARLEDPADDSARDLSAALTAYIPGKVLHLRGHRWRYARAAARIAAPCAYDEHMSLGVAGDGFAAGTSAPSCSRAVLSGRALAQRIIAANHISAV